MPDAAYTEVSFYIVAHEDDWQLFMNPNAYHDLVSLGSKVVYIITTAGDAGQGSTYWGSREEGTKSSVRFCLAPLGGLQQSGGTAQYNNHTINYWSSNNTKVFFLRLPDGNMDGNGFPLYGNQSLPKLRDGALDTITTVDSSATYNGWSDLYTTLQAIVQDESVGISNVWVNYQNPDTNANPGDHPDHIATGQAVQAMPSLSQFQQALFVGYNVRNLPDTLDGSNLFWKSGMFAAYEKAMFDGSGHSTLSEELPTYLAWCLSAASYITS